MITTALLLFLAGLVEYTVMAAWYDWYIKGHIVWVVTLTHIQLVLWMWVLKSILSILDSPETSNLVALSYIEGCSLAAGIMCWRVRKKLESV